MLERGLAAQGFDVSVANSADSALALVRSDVPALAILDVNLPGPDGFELLEALRGVAPGLPVIMLTARSDVEDRIHGLELGAVDYVVKPFSFRELTARIKAQLRRETEAEQPAATEVLRVGDVTLDLYRREVESPEGVFVLSDREFNLLAYMMHGAGQVFSRTQLAEGAWETMTDIRSNIVDVYIAYLRAKVGQRAIETVRGVGYRMPVR